MNALEDLLTILRQLPNKEMAAKRLDEILRDVSSSSKEVGYALRMDRLPNDNFI